MSELVDMLGHKVEVGSRIASAFTQGNMAELRVGTVIGFASQKAAYSTESRQQIVVKWEVGSGYYPIRSDDKPTKIFIDLRRFVVIGEV